MPEAPELEVVREFLTAKAVGAVVESAAEVRPGVLRSLRGDMAEDARGRVLEGVRRRGKFVLLDFSGLDAKGLESAGDDGLDGGRMLVINPMLTGALQYCLPSQRVYKRTYITLGLSNGHELRYLDDKRMGMAYYCDAGQLGDIPRLGEQGPDALDGMGLDEFRERLKGFHGEIKGILTRGRVVAGIGNAYSDEILFEAGVYPFRKRKALSDEELARLHRACSRVVLDAIPKARERMGDNIHLKARDFLRVHNKGGEACPRCGNRISQITANKRITSYCRRCQPGMLLRN